MMQKAMTVAQELKLWKATSLILGVEVMAISAVATWAMEKQEKRYRLFWQQYEILAKYANWEDPMIKHEMQTLIDFRKIVDPPEDED